MSIVTKLTYSAKLEPANVLEVALIATETTAAAVQRCTTLYNVVYNVVYNVEHYVEHYVE